MKKVLVIGASGLIGSHVVQAFKGTAEVIEASFGSDTMPVDITDRESLVTLLRAVGLVDAIICTAGVVRFAPWASDEDASWTHGLANKLMGQINVVRLGSDFIRPGGSITLTTGVLAQYPMPGSSIVTTVNAALEAFVRAAAVELPATIRVNAVSPGWVTETMVAMGMDPAPGLPAAEVAQHFVVQANSGKTGTVAVAAKQ